MSFVEMLYLISLFGCIALLCFRGQLQMQTAMTKVLSILTTIIISLIPGINTIVLIMLILDWMADSYQYKLAYKKKRPF